MVESCTGKTPSEHTPRIKFSLIDPARLNRPPCILYTGGNSRVCTGKHARLVKIAHCYSFGRCAVGGRWELPGMSSSRLPQLTVAQ